MQPRTPPPETSASAAVLAHRLALLDALIDALAETSAMGPLLERALTTLTGVAGVDAGAVFLWDEQSSELRLAAHRGVSEELARVYAERPGDSLFRAASQADAAAIISGVTTQQQPRPEMQQEGFQSFAIVPLHLRGRVIGAMAVLSRTLTHFDGGDTGLLTQFGKQLGLAVDRAQLIERERQRAGQLQMVSEVGRRLGAILAENELLAGIVHDVRQRLGYQSASLLLVAGGGHELEVVAASGLDNETLIGVRVPADPERSMAGWAIANRAPLLANDVTQEPRHFPGAGRERSELTVPVHAGGQALGVLDVQADRTGAFAPSDVEVLQILAGQIAVALENARLYETAQRSLRQMRAFQRVSTAITGSLDLHATLEHALDAAMDVFDADRAALFVDEPQAHRINFVTWRNLSAGYRNAVVDYYNHSEWPEEFETARHIHVPDIQRAAVVPELQEVARHEGFCSMLFLPLRDGRTRLGTFVLYHDRPRTYSAEELGLAYTLADQTTIAIRHARLYETERRAREQTATILAATRTVSRSLDFDAVLQDAGRCIAAALGQRACGIWLLTEDGEALNPAHRIAEQANATADAAFRALPAVPLRGLPEQRRALLAGRPHIVEEAELSERERTIQRAFPFRRYVSVPLAVRETVLGIVAVPIRDPNYWVRDDELDAATAIARSTALALENARLYEQAAQLAVSEERNRLARELHDSVTHALFSMTLIIQALPRILERDPARGQERIERLHELGRGALAEMRALIFHLRPAALAEQGLAVALAKHTAAFESREGVQVDLQIDGERRLPHRIEEALFRVAQEALNNVAKHAAARRVHIRLAITAAHAELVVQDDGRGFSASEAGPGLGMTSMQERAALLGGVFQVESAPGKGTMVRVRVPVSG